MGSAGTISIRSQDVGRVAADTAFFAAAGLRAGFELPLGAAWVLEGHLDGVAAIVRPTVMFNRAEVWRMPLFSAALGVGAVAYFP
ncbi:MAG: hypothetical protein QM756_34595 [Polyangiaceae bacterium]